MHIQANMFRHISLDFLGLWSFKNIPLVWIVKGRGYLDRVIGLRSGLMGTASKVLGGREAVTTWSSFLSCRLETQVKDPLGVLPHHYLHRPLKATAPISAPVRHRYLGLPVTTGSYGQLGGSRNSVQWPAPQTVINIDPHTHQWLLQAPITPKSTPAP